MRYKNGTTYEGSWANDLRHGQGTFSWPNGAKYVGFFVSGSESSGTYITEDGKECGATWVSAPASAAGQRPGAGYKY